MFRIKVQAPRFHAVVLTTALLVYPYGAIAQHGGGGIGGGLAGGGGLSGGSGMASGLDTKDDLKGFHDVLALQATTQQVGEFRLMLKISDSAISQLQAFEEQAAKQNPTQADDAAKTALHAIEQARTANAKFLEQLSNRQREGLRDTIRKLNKTDSELSQQANALELDLSHAKIGTQSITGSVEILQRTLSSFRDEQLSLGDEMNIGQQQATGDQISFNIPAAKILVDFQSQPVAIITSGVVSRIALSADQNAFRVQFTADLADLQQNMTEVLRTELNKSDSCGEQITIQTAALTPSGQTSSVLAQLHYERWACFGRGVANEMAEGNGSIEVMLTPSIAQDGTLHLSAAISRVEGEGLVGDLLRSGSLGEMIRDKIAETVLSAVRQGTDYAKTLPPAAQGNVTLQRAQFNGTGSGVLSVTLAGEIHVSSDKLAALASELKAGESKGAPAAEATTR